MRIATTALAVALTTTLTAAGPPKFQTVAIGAEGVNHNARSASFEEGGRFTAINASLHVLIVTAYRGVWPPQETPALQVLGGPDWLGTEGFTIAALAPAGSSRPEMQEMLKTLLADRFGLKARHEVRQLPMYRLVMARKDRRPGAKLQPTAGPCLNTPVAAPPDPSGLPRCSDRFGASRLHSRRLSLVGMTMDQLAASLSGLNFVGGPVFNQTDLDGIFDVDLEFTTGVKEPAAFFNADAAGAAATDTDTRLSIFDAMADQLGLKLEAVKKGPVEVVVIDHADRPTAD
jgi:uncharacterized protein (TIGR03435 family)